MPPTVTDNTSVALFNVVDPPETNGRPARSIVPPLSTVVLLTAPIPEIISRPPLSTVVLEMTPKLTSTWEPPASTVADVDEPNPSTYSAPPLPTVVSTATPWL